MGLRLSWIRSRSRAGARAAGRRRRARRRAARGRRRARPATARAAARPRRTARPRRRTGPSSAGAIARPRPRSRAELARRPRPDRARHLVAAARRVGDVTGEPGDHRHRVGRVVDRGDDRPRRARVSARRNRSARAAAAVAGAQRGGQAARGRSSSRRRRRRAACPSRRRAPSGRPRPTASAIAPVPATTTTPGSPPSAPRWAVTASLVTIDARCAERAAATAATSPVEAGQARRDDVDVAAGERAQDAVVAAPARQARPGRRRHADAVDEVRPRGTRSALRRSAARASSSKWFIPLCGRLRSAASVARTL